MPIDRRRLRSFVAVGGLTTRCRVERQSHAPGACSNSLLLRIGGWGERTNARQPLAIDAGRYGSAHSCGSGEWAAASATGRRAGNALPNIGRPLRDDSSDASSWITSQCSARTPSSRRMTSSTIQFVGWPIPENRPWTNHKVVFGQHHARLVPERWRDASDQVEKALATRRDVRAMLNVVR
jgi:hypothetical protein